MYLSLKWSLRFFFIQFMGIILLSLSGYAHSEKVSINASWQFLLNDTLSPAETLDAHGWKWVNIPHTWNKEDPFDDVAGYHRGIGWYRKTLVIDETDRNQVFIQFDAANQQTWVYVNGEPAGAHIGGYSGFVIDATPFVRWGKPNQILVKVSNKHHPDIPPLSADFTFFGGIYRDTWLIRKKDIHFDLLDGSTKGIYTSTPQINHSNATLHVKSNIRNVSGRAANMELSVKLLDSSMQTVATVRKPVQLAAAENTTAQVQLQIDEPRLWSPDSPTLYTVHTQITDAQTGEVHDQYVHRWGFRWFEMNENMAFMINGQVTDLIGVNRHQDFPGFGNALPNAIHEKDIQLIKDMGVNFLRLAHYQQAPAVLEACDRLGLIIYEEIPLVNAITISDDYYRNTQNMMKEMIRQHHNHPSIAMWGIANEVLIQHWVVLGENGKYAHLSRQEYFDHVRTLIVALDSLTRAEDPHRFTVIANHGDLNLHEEAGLNSITDIVGWNLYYGWYLGDIEYGGEFLDKFYAMHPNRGQMISEYGAGSDLRIRAIEPVRFDFSVEWATLFLNAYLRHMLSKPHVMGGGVWAFADFSSEGRVDAVPNMNSKGLVNYDRTLKDPYLLYQAAFSQTPYLRFGGLDWPHRKGFANENGRLDHPIIIFTNLPQAEIIINGQSHGVFISTDNQITATLPLSQGINRIEAKSGSEVYDRTELTATIIPQKLSTMAPHQIHLNMNMGAHFYFNDNISGEIWLPEQEWRPGSLGYVGGSVLLTHNWMGSRVGVDSPIGCTVNEPLYQTTRDSIVAFRADLPPGWYDVTLHFAELYGGHEREILPYNLGADIIDEIVVDERSFEVTTNTGKTLIINDLVNLQATPYRFRIQVEENHGLELNFTPIAGSTFLSAISIKGV